ncbi:hypothetical protein Gbth_002_019 [Gluconobacter thailandicus F149-1 = NBRC 100600]|uniref:DUF4167 domain-containing protein n=1 Tax=Gluconobacter thailandicus TaxID=257438 RepID=A0AAP9EU27_GLUTH|nr:DUF4167 domain-containing protein [Gluconobacter thailandicus]ANQ42383.1 hypothetical protein BAR24_13520 [Gluconobacter oxydans]GAN89132.1 hypothetical protein Gbfr_003_067 [Gluconobacter frateurii M-2]KXV53230.1 hypothetical protein AD946_08625 [Gluconobacter thailandicus]QEH97433.1 DUF4167 domain-containing protein [Gluconobacter thailandicus]GAC86873.1 hypothetical protein NBRC3255_0534 [Gluconobacter thailandicus NBRC 3255]
MNMKRIRGRHHRAGGGTPRSSNSQTPLNRNHVFDSNGPDLRIRGTAQQLFEKYLQLGRDATGTGDRILAEAYFQHAEHYFRILNAMNQAAQQSQQERNERQQQRQRAYEERREPGSERGGDENGHHEGDEQPSFRSPRSEEAPAEAE